MKKTTIAIAILICGAMVFGGVKKKNTKTKQKPVAEKTTKKSKGVATAAARANIIPDATLSIEGLEPELVEPVENEVSAETSAPAENPVETPVSLDLPSENSDSSSVIDITEDVAVEIVE